MEVVELADRRDPGERHLGEGRPRQREVRVGIEAVGHRVHLLAPGPERAAPGLRSPRSARWKAWECALASPGIVTPARRSASGAAASPGLDRRDPLAVDLDRTSAATASPPSQASSQKTASTTGAASRAVPPHDVAARAFRIPPRWPRSYSSQLMTHAGSARSRISVPSRWSISCWKVPAVSPARLGGSLASLAVQVANPRRHRARDLARGRRGATGNPR